MLIYKKRFPENIIVYEFSCYKLLQIISSNPIKKVNSVCINGVFIKYFNNNANIRQFSYFDFTVLCALLTTFECFGEQKNFSTMTILKILRGNKQARFSKNSKKLGTLNKKMIEDSLAYMNNVFLFALDNQSYDERTSFLSIKQVGNFYKFEKEPKIINLFEILGFKSQSYSINFFNLYKICNRHFHEGQEFISFKFWVLSSLIKDYEVQINQSVVKRILKIDKVEEKAKKDLALHKISKSIYKKRLNETYFKFHLFVKMYGDFLKAYGIIDEYKFNQNQMIIFYKK